MLRAGESRQRLARALNAAYGDGLLSESTHAHRLDQLFGSLVVDPARLVGDLTFRSPRRTLATAIGRTVRAAEELFRSASWAEALPRTLLALDWTGDTEELIVGRHPQCDVVLADPSVSRRHARLRFRDGGWMLHDLESTNGTMVNAVPVVRCRLMPGDHLTIGSEHLLVD